MFSQKILQIDLSSLNILKNQRDNCKKLIASSFRDLVSSEELTREIVNSEKATIESIYAHLQDLENEIALLEDQMYLNYVNQNSFAPGKRKKPGTSFPHFDTINS